jgi:chromosome partition protein MukE
MNQQLNSIGDIVEQAEFPALDSALRKGRHIDRDDGEWFALLHDGQAHIETWYRRYGCELIYKSDGYFYLLPVADKYPKRQLAAAEMLVGQTLALLYLDPRSIERAGIVTREMIVEQLVMVLGSDMLIRAFLPQRKRMDERLAQKEVRSKIADATRRLASLGFVTSLADDKWQIRASIMRFAEPVRGVEDPAAALSRLVALGDVALETASHDDNQTDEDISEGVDDDEQAITTQVTTLSEPSPSKLVVEPQFDDDNDVYRYPDDDDVDDE